MVWRHSRYDITIRSSISNETKEPRSVGTPPQTLGVVFDTGSTSLEFASTLCGSSCARQRKFDSSKSSTFTDGGRTQTITFGTGVGVDPVIGNNWQLSLRSATDVVSIGGLNAGRVSLFLITKQTPTFSPEPFDGIQGVLLTLVNSKKAWLNCCFPRNGSSAYWYLRWSGEAGITRRLQLALHA